MDIPVAIGITSVIFRDQITSSANDFYTCVQSYLYNQVVIISRDEPKLDYAMRETIKEFNTDKSKITLREVSGSLEEDLVSGTYIYYRWPMIECVDKYMRRIYLTLYDDKIIVWSLKYVSTDELKSMIESKYNKFCAPSAISVFFLSDHEKWSPIIRRPRELDLMKKTPIMEAILKDVDNFFSSAETFKRAGLPYRQGYLFIGAIGQGKTTTIEMIAQKYNMDTYMLNLNANNMTDATLIKLVATVPPCSLIVIEEFEKQLENIRKDSTNKISDGGILSALDGPSRLSHGTIVIITANNIGTIVCGNNFKDALLRQGRIDKTFEFIDPQNNVVQEDDQISKVISSKSCILIMIMFLIHVLCF